MSAADENVRIAIVNEDKCKPKKCRQECKRSCPVVRMGKMCIEVEPTKAVAWISEELCIGCGICVKKCPFDAIQIINLPRSLAKETTHRYGPNSFKLHRLPMPRPSEVLGLVGSNGVGKSTALKILAGKLKPNLGKFDAPPNWEDILKHFRGSELQNYFHRVLDDKLRAITKPQFVDSIPKAVKGNVGALIRAKDDRGVADKMLVHLQLDNLQARDVEVLSGGELQRFAIAMLAVQTADVYMFDEPSSYLDIRQRLKAGAVIRSLVARDYLESSAVESGEAPLLDNKYVIVVEHDLAVLDYLSDFICVLYGTPGAYGVVTMPFSVREGINIFLAGFIPTENLRFREDGLSFKVATGVEEESAKPTARYTYPAMHKTMTGRPGAPPFTLHVEPGEFSDSQIIVLLGENGTGKTTFVRMLAGLTKADPDAAGKEAEIAGFSVSYKPQKLPQTYEGSVRSLLHERIREAMAHPQFKSDVLNQLSLEGIMDNEVKNLSGGELQRVALALSLGKPADVYLLDEPSAYLDSEQRIIACKIIKRYILHAKKTAFIVEHDFIMATYLADRVIVYRGEPGREATACTPDSLLSGMNDFLKQLEITFRRDPSNFRPRINKRHSVKDMEQKKGGNYFYLEE